MSDPASHENRICRPGRRLRGDAVFKVGHFRTFSDIFGHFRTFLVGNVSRQIVHFRAFPCIASTTCLPRRTYSVVKELSASSAEPTPSAALRVCAHGRATAREDRG